MGLFQPHVGRGKAVEQTLKLPPLDELDVNGKTVLVRCDLNVPMEGGRVADNTRILRMLPTLQHLLKKKARVVLLSHFDRPEGKFVPSMSLAPLVDPLAALLGQEVKFGVDCIGPAAKEAVSKVKPGEIVLLENLRFHAQEEANDASFARELASLGDFYVNDAFSCSHRTHASVVGITEHLPFAAGLLLKQEVETLDRIFSAPERPLAAIVGGAKVSTKLALLENLIAKVDIIVIGGAMANTFLLAKGHSVGKSKCEKDMVPTAKKILAAAEKAGCRIVLPVDLVVTENFEPHAACLVVAVDDIPASCTATDIGPASVALIGEALAKCKMVVWNGPVGAFETRPFDASTVQVARILSGLTRKSKVQTIAGGGDTMAAIAHAGLSDAFTYLSTAGGAFLEWLEGKELPGIAALSKTETRPRVRA